MGADHARIFAEELPGASLQVICDNEGATARRIADEFGAVDIATDAESVILRPDVDAVVLASPDFTHAPLSMACIAAGKNVLCEKPLSQSPEECQLVMRAEAEAGQKYIQLGFMRRYDRSYIEMKEANFSGSLGRVLMMHNFHRNVETPALDFTGAMAITNSAPHEFDVIRYVMGTEFTSISAWQPKRSDDLVAPVIMVLETKDGQIVNIEVNNNAAYGYDVKAELVGEKGTISTNEVTHTRINSALQNSTSYDVDWRTRYAEAYRQQNRDFLTFVETGVFPEICSDSWDGYCASLVAESGANALKNNRKIAINMIAKPEFYQ